MNYRLRLSRSAEAYLNRLSADIQERMERKLAALIDNPLDPQHSKPLANAAGLRSARIGGWRILFTVDTEALLIRVETIAPRGQAYRDL